MTSSTILRFQWDFPLGWWGFAAAVVISIAIIIISYRNSVRPGEGWKKVVLSLTRLLILAALLFFLGNPRMEEINEFHTLKQNKIGVVFDTSSSMTKKGFMGKSRLEDALAIWEKGRKGAARNMRFEYFGSDEKFYPAVTVKEIRSAMERKNVANTNLYRNISEWNGKLPSGNYDAVICFTDGIDTSGDSINRAVQSLCNSGLRHVFIPVTTELEMRSYAALKKIESQSKVLKGTKVPVSIFADYCNLPVRKELSINVTKSGDGAELFKGKLSQRSISGTGVFNFEIPVETEGIELVKAELKLDGKILDSAEWSIEGCEDENKKVLLYLGTFDWAQRFLEVLFSKSRRAQLSVCFAEGVLKTPMSGIEIGFPDEEKLADYDVVIIANIKKSQMSTRMESALKKYVSSGKGLLFITGNPLLSREFANSPLEEFLPVEFTQDPERAKRYDKETMNFLNYAKRYKKAALRTEGAFKRNKENAFNSEPLRKFVITPEGKETPIFTKEDGDLIIPLFRDCAAVKYAKAGAEVLATAPNDNGTEDIIMAVQRFGRGRSALLATDTLWRWRLGIPSDCNDYEVFWENLVSWLGGGGDAAGSWVLPTFYAVAGKEFKGGFKLPKNAGKEKKMEFFVRCGITETKLEMRPGKEDGVVECHFVPEKPGTYELCAGKTASAYFTVAGKSLENRELEMLTPDVAGLKRLEAAPNASVISPGQDIDTASLSAPREDVIKEKKDFPLWRTGWIFLLVMIFYSTDLIVRRIIKMV